ncbi:MAG: AtpZ/AtpI family protein [Paracoccaceae bacterium]|nr:AtpZ/AtpI family protein [Paracoccaceae bacterium]
MPDARDPDDLEQLEARIRAAKASKEGGLRHGGQETAVGAVWQMVLELVVGMAMGSGIGYGLDALFGTLPIFLMLFSLLGFAAGVRTMMRTAADMQKRQEKSAKADNAER